MKKIVTQLMIILMTGAFLFSGTMVFAAQKIKVGVSVPAADHGWTAGLLWWAKKAVKDIEARDKAEDKLSREKNVKKDYPEMPPLLKSSKSIRKIKF